MQEQEYVGHVLDLAATEYHSELVSESDLDSLFFSVAAVTKAADQVKRALFYGRPMTLKYDQLSSTTVEHRPELMQLFHGILGMFTEAGELMDAMERICRGAEPDVVNLIEEAGDLTWYLALLGDYLGISVEKVREVNIAKLRKRYPDKFSLELSENRDVEAERVVLASVITG